jgi:hypothetical protein
MVRHALHARWFLPVCCCLVLPALQGAEPKSVSIQVRANSEHPGYEAYRALDGDPQTMWHTEFGNRDLPGPHQITLDLGKPYTMSGVVYTPRVGCGNGTIAQFECFVGDHVKKLGSPVLVGEFPRGVAKHTIRFAAPVQGRYFRLRALSEVNGRPWASIAELELTGAGVAFRAKNAGPASLVHEDGTPFSETEIQYVSLLSDLRRRSHFARVAEEAYHPQSLIFDSDQDPLDVVLRRTAALAADLKKMPDAPDLSDLERQLDALRDKAEETDVDDETQRIALYEQVCAVRRKIAFSNPLLDFDDIVFIKRRRALFNHLCDQYYGMAAAPGGGLYVLEGAFGDRPRVRDVLADSVVQNGRLAGEKLWGGPSDVLPTARFDGNGNRVGKETPGGTFLSPDLSFDAKTVLFAYVENRGEMQHRHHTDPTQGHWHEGRCYHIFRVNVDGSDLQQLTDGTFNDFDPCWLPNGRIAFISERRGGYLRCGRVCPNYTLYDMAADGSDITCLSPHETNEWHPSVNNEGLILWTRWDYVDRHGCTAHMPWVTTLDGRNPRPVHGNYAVRQTRPDMESDCRAIPDSNKIVAVASPHHGQSFGSLILIDPSLPDDDSMGPIRRLTPDVGFPETQGGAQAYGTPWPLSDNYHLCIYDATMQPGVGGQGKGYVPGKYGIYLVDAFGNRELIYRDAEIPCFTPIPLQPRPMPAASQELARGVGTDPATRHEVEKDFANAEGTVAVANVYNGLKPWPESTKITHLRVFQLLPMPVPSGGLRPHETGRRVASARDSVVPCRWVLGTVPVEPDGSAHFTVPANREVFFQALDENGLAIQSMRSATHVREGEVLTCVGCHEPKTRAAVTAEGHLMALQRPPSRLQPDVDGSAPFSYPRLVQPVLDRNCVECHAKHRDDNAPNLAREPITNKWYASYNNLVEKFGFYDYGDSYRTTPGRFGAKASKLYQLLQEGHYDVELSEEDMHRLTLWLDSTSMFYGVYEREGGQAQLRGEVAMPTLE